jgi:two-component system CheB/CheR fusion protein
MENMFIVALGASAGGLKSITDFFSSVDQTYPVAYVITVHVPRDHQTLLPTILSRFTSMRVVEISQGAPIEPRKVYVNPPGAKVSFHDGVFILRSRSEKEPVNQTIDYLFKSLAASARENAVGIILSGTGSDGTDGLKAIEAHRGITMVQDPSTAEFDGMPMHSIKFDHPDFVLEPKQMPERIYEFIRSKLAATADKTPHESS